MEGGVRTHRKKDNMEEQKNSRMVFSMEIANTVGELQVENGEMRFEKDFDLVMQSQYNNIYIEISRRMGIKNLFYSIF